MPKPAARSFWIGKVDESTTKDGYVVYDPVFKELHCVRCSFYNFSKPQMLRHIREKHEEFKKEPSKTLKAPPTAKLSEKPALETTDCQAESSSDSEDEDMETQSTDVEGEEHEELVSVKVTTLQDPLTDEFLGIPASEKADLKADYIETKTIDLGGLGQEKNTTVEEIRPTIRGVSTPNMLLFCDPGD